MLQNILAAMILTLQERNSATVYSGWGTTIDRMIEEYYSSGGEWHMIRRVEYLAEYMAR